MTDDAWPPPTPSNADMEFAVDFILAISAIDHERNKLRAIDLSRRLAVHMASQNALQQIETAPRDGTEFLLWRTGWKLPVAAKIDDGFIETLYTDGSTMETWWTGDHGFYWQPLPKPPKE